MIERIYIEEEAFGGSIGDQRSPKNISHLKNHIEFKDDGEIEPEPVHIQTITSIAIKSSALMHDLRSFFGFGHNVEYSKIPTGEILYKEPPPTEYIERSDIFNFFEEIIINISKGGELATVSALRNIMRIIDVYTDRDDKDAINYGEDNFENFAIIVKNKVANLLENENTALDRLFDINSKQLDIRDLSVLIEAIINKLKQRSVDFSEHTINQDQTKIIFSIASKFANLKSHLMNWSMSADERSSRASIALFLEPVMISLRDNKDVAVIGVLEEIVEIIFSIMVNCNNSQHFLANNHWNTKPGIGCNFFVFFLSRYM